MPLASSIRRFGTRPQSAAPAGPALLEHHPDPAWLYDRSLGKLQHANAAACQLLSASVAEQQRQPALFQFATEERTRLKQQIQQALRRKTALRLADIHVERPDGVRCPVEVVATWAEPGNHVVLWVRDISDRLLQHRDQASRLRMEREARERAEAEKERLEFLSSAGRHLAQSLDYPSTLACVARLAVPGLASWCIVDVLMDDDSLRREAVAHLEADKIMVSCELQQHGGPRPGQPSSLWSVLSSGRPLCGTVLDGDIPDFSHDPVSAQLLLMLGVTSYMVVALQARGRTIGCITMGTTERAYQPRDVELAEGLARQSALAIDNAIMYRDCSAVADMLERSLMLPQLPRVAGIEMAVHYQPAHLDNSVGGDFYDISETLDDRSLESPPSRGSDRSPKSPPSRQGGRGSDRWAIVLGDIRGKGLPAATLTALARYTLRAASLQGKAPAEALDLLNHALVRQDVNRRSCTAVYGVLEKHLSGARVTFSVAGHPLPWVLRHDGRVETAGQPGRLMGLVPHLDLQEHQVDLGPGDAMVFYTDGITDARLNDQPFEDELPAVLARACGLDAQGIVDRVEREIMDWQDAPCDDRALLVVRVKNTP